MKKINFEEAKKRFIVQGRSDILLLEKGYKCWRENAWFMDLVLNKEFVAIPKNVYLTKSKHPERAKEQRKNTNLIKYGNFCSLHGETADGKLVQQKTKETCKQKFLVEHPWSSPFVKNKIRKTVMERYGIVNISQLRKKTVKETGEFVENWLARQPEPKPATYSSFGAMFLYGSNSPLEYSLVDLEKFLNSFRDSKTKLEKECCDLFSAVHFNKKISTLVPYRPDFKLSDNCFLNCDGLYWHSEQQKTKFYHLEMRKKFEINNLFLFQFYENEIKNQPQIVKSIVANKLGKTQKRIFARKTSIQMVSQQEAEIWLKQNHLMGPIRAKHLGLYFNGKLVSLLSYKEFKKHCKIERFCSVLDTVVTGGFSKLLVALKTKINKNIREIHYWTDLRYGSGKHLEKYGFLQVKETLGWKWTDGRNTMNRLKCRANMDNRKLSEKEYAAELSWFRIYDAGQRLFVSKF